MKDEKNKQIIGCEEWCAFPDLGIPSIKARVDSGAKTSSIHAFNVQKFRRQGETWVSFEVHPLQNNRRTVVRCERPIVDKRVVKSSSGISETRYVILATLKMGDQAWEIELTTRGTTKMVKSK